MMENEESIDQKNTSDNRISNEDPDKVPEKTIDSWDNDIFDDTDPNVRKDTKAPKRTLFY